jgi:hypothetical protein
MVLELLARFGSSIEEYSGRDHVADRPARFTVKRLDLRVAGIFRVGFDDRVSPKTTVAGSFDIDGQRCVADVLAVDLDSSTCGLRDDLDFQPRSYGVRVRRTPGEHQKSESHHGWKNGAELWEGPMHESCLSKIRVVRLAFCL